MTLSSVPAFILATAFFLIGPLGAVGGKGLVVALLLAGLGAIALLLLRRPPLASAPKSLLFLLALFLGLGMTSAAWAPDGYRAVSITAKVTGLSVAAVAVLWWVSTAPSRQVALLYKPLLAGFVLGTLILAVGAAYAMATGKALWGSYQHAALTTLSNGEAVLAMLVWPVAAIVLTRWGPWPAGILFCGLAIGLSLLMNSAVLLSLATGTVAAVIVFFLKRRGIRLLAFVAVVAILSAPGALKLLPSGDEMFQKVGSIVPSAVHRLYTWHFTGERIMEAPWFGWGMEASRVIPGGHDKLYLDPFSIWGNEIMPLHPHNATLQVWLELGLAGALVMAALVFSTYAGRLSEPMWRSPIALPLRAGASSAFLVIANLSYGVWQNWWIAMGWLLAAATMVVARTTGIEEGETAPTGAEDRE